MPKALSREEAARLLDACQAVQRWPKRGYAMARCALDLGLRAGEIAHLMIGDIDWQAGTVTLRATKSRRQMSSVPSSGCDGEAADRPRVNDP